MCRFPLWCGAAFSAGWFAAAVAMLIAAGQRGWWVLIERSAEHGHLRFASAGLLLAVLPFLLTGTLIYCWRRVRYLPYCVTAAVALVTPALVIPRLAHLLPAAGWVVLGIVEVIGLLSVYAIAARSVSPALA